MIKVKKFVKMGLAAVLLSTWNQYADAAEIKLESFIDGNARDWSVGMKLILTPPEREEVPVTATVTWSDTVNQGKTGTFNPTTGYETRMSVSDNSSAHTSMFFIKATVKRKDNIEIVAARTTDYNECIMLP